MAEASQATDRSKTIHRVSGFKAAVVWLLAMFIKAWCATIRFSAPANFRSVEERAEPMVAMFWHNRLFAVPWAVKNIRPARHMHGLVSASRDGAMLARFFEFLGIGTVRGSSSRMGREGLHRLIEVNRSGYDVGITPDGPRGPLYDMKAGGILAARRARSPVLLIGIEFHSAWRLNSWDRFYLPVPFSQATVRLQIVEQKELRSRENVAESLKARLLELNGESE